MLCWNSVLKGAIIFSILGVTVCGVGCVDKDTKESEEKYVEEEYKEEGLKGVEEELSEYRNKFIEMYTQNIYDEANGTMEIMSN